MIDSAPRLLLELPPEDGRLQSDAAAIPVSEHSKRMRKLIVSDFAVNLWPWDTSELWKKTYPAYILFSPWISWSSNNPTGFSTSSDLKAMNAQ